MKLSAAAMDRLELRLAALAPIGRSAEGVLWRKALTTDDRQACALVGEWMRATGMSVRRDMGGNLIGRIEGAEPGAKAVVTGSHLDSVRGGGNYDGPLGVVGGLLAVEELLKAHGKPRKPLEVVAFTGEEGSRFGGGFIGAKAWAGDLESDLSKQDAEGITIAEALAAEGFDPARLEDARRSDVGAYIEVHIEQGRVLESRGIPLGIVTGITGMHQLWVRVGGRADHAGTTPMDLRQDAMRAAARMIDRAIALVEAAGPPAVVTAGRMTVAPGMANVVPEKVEFTFDFREPDVAKRARLIGEIEALCRAEAENKGLGLEWDLYHDVAPVPGDPGILQVLRKAALACGHQPLEMVSGAGHDAMVVARIAPMAMIFTPCRDGRSHHESEYASREQMQPGIEVLAGAMHRLAY